MNESKYYAGKLKMDSKLASHIWSMLQAFWPSKARTKIFVYLLVLVVVISVTIFGQLPAERLESAFLRRNRAEECRELSYPTRRVLYNHRHSPRA